MRKVVAGIIVLFMTGITGCSSVSFTKGEILDEYVPMDIGVVSDKDAAIVKVTSGLFIWKVDKQEIVGKFRRNLHLGSKPYAVRVVEGKHDIYLMSDGSNILVKGLSTVAGHEYLIESLIKMERYSSKIYYWVRDLNDGTIVYGKEMTQEKLMSKESD
jgi:hypothetical protein